MKFHEDNEAHNLRLTHLATSKSLMRILPINEGPGIIKPMRMKTKARKLNKSKLTNVKKKTLEK